MKLRKFIIPALLSALLLVLASPVAQAFSGYFYVTSTSFPLRECAAYECDKLLTAYQGDKVEILERTSTGWSKVRLVDRAAIGWIPSNMLSFSPDLSGKPVPQYYVNTSSLPLRDGPSPNSNVLTTMHFNDPVEMLGVTASGWAQVRDQRSSTVGWVDPRYVSEAPAVSPRSSRRHRPPARKAAPKEETPAPPSAM
jgi:uncharacterized protein YgiM (DUF1202 family)